MSSPRATPRRLELLDYGRFFAALSVVLFHYTFNGINNGKISSITYIEPVAQWSRYGYLGVEFFFMISGYVIFYSAKSASASTFAVSRVLRLYPAYWFAVLLTSAVALVLGGRQMAVQPLQVVANLSMMQSAMGIAPVDGVYWTLVYELKFYFAILVLLLLGQQKRLEQLMMAWPLLLLAAFLVGAKALLYLGGYYAYFCAGALFAVLRQQFRWQALAGLAITAMLCIQFSAGNAAALSAEKGVAFSPMVIAMIVSMFFGLFFVQNTQAGQSLRLPAARTLGALTYPVYLIHAHIGYMLLSRFATQDNKVGVYALVLAGVIALAWGVNKVVEQRLAPQWQRLFERTVGRAVTALQTGILRLRSALGHPRPQ